MPSDKHVTKEKSKVNVYVEGEQEQNSSAVVALPDNRKINRAIHTPSGWTAVMAKRILTSSALIHSTLLLLIIIIIIINHHHPITIASKSGMVIVFSWGRMTSSSNELQQYRCNGENDDAHTQKRTTIRWWKGYPGMIFVDTQWQEITLNYFMRAMVITFDQNRFRVKRIPISTWKLAKLSTKTKTSRLQKQQYNVVQWKTKKAGSPDRTTGLLITNQMLYHWAKPAQLRPGLIVDLPKCNPQPDQDVEPQTLTFIFNHSEKSRIIIFYCNLKFVPLTEWFCGNNGDLVSSIR